MTTRAATLPPATGRWGRFRVAASRLANGAVGLAASRAVPVASHLRDNIYTIMGLGFIAGAAFVHSLFTGLLVTGILFLVFEWKVSD